MWYYSSLKCCYEIPGLIDIENLKTGIQGLKFLPAEKHQRGKYPAQPMLPPTYLHEGENNLPPPHVFEERRRSSQDALPPLPPRQAQSELPPHSLSPQSSSQNAYYTSPLSHASDGRSYSSLSLTESLGTV